MVQSHGAGMTQRRLHLLKWLTVFVPPTTVAIGHSLLGHAAGRPLLGHPVGGTRGDHPRARTENTYAAPAAPAG
jgi:hypothetical protein